MKPISTYLILILFSFSACATEKKVLNEVIIEMANIPKRGVAINELFDSFEYIPLETSERSIFGQVSKLIVYDQKFFIHDRSTKKLYVFYEDGTFSHTIGTVGQGPNEYTHLEDFVIDKKNRQVVILSYPSIVYIYDLAGEFISKRNLGIPPVWSICWHADGFVVSNNNQSFSDREEALLYFFDEDFKLKHEMGTALLNNILPSFVSHPILKDGENIAYFDALSSRLTFINTQDLNNSKSIRFVLQNPVPLGGTRSDVQAFLNNQNKYSFFFEAYLADSILWTTLGLRGEQHIFVKNFKTNEQILSKFQSRWPRIFYQTNGYFYTVLRSEWLSDEHSIPVTECPVDFENNPIIVRFRKKPSIF